MLKIAVNSKPSKLIRGQGQFKPITKPMSIYTLVTEAIEAGHKRVVSPINHVYFNNQSEKEDETLPNSEHLALEKDYTFDLIPDNESPQTRRFMLGTQANLSTESLTISKHVEDFLVHRFCVLSQSIWTKQENKNYQSQLKPQLKRLELLNVKKND